MHAHIYARGLTADRAAALIADQLVTAGVLEPQTEPRNASELVGQAQRAVETGHAPPVVLVDGLDEARGEAFPVAEELLARLAAYAVIVVSTRELRRGDDQPSLLDMLAPRGPRLDLDDPAAQDRTRTDLGDYITARLAARDPRMDAQAVAGYLTGEASMTADRPFLLARLVTDQLRASPVDTSVAGWQEQVSLSIEAAFDTDLAAIGPPPHRQTGPQLDGAGLARALLSALTWGYGRGFSEEEWLAAANALSPGTAFDRDDLLWLLDQLGRYILQDGEAGVAVYRVAHQSLTEHLRPVFRVRHDQLFDPHARRVTESLAARYQMLMAGGVDATDPGYLWRYLWRHAADSGPAGTCGFAGTRPGQPFLAARRRYGGLADRRPAARVGVPPGRSGARRGSRPALPRPGRRQPRLPPRPRRGAEQPRRPLQRGGPPPGRPGTRRGSRPALPRPGRRQPRLPPRPRRGAEQPRQPLRRGGPPPGRPGTRRGSRPALPRPGRRQPRLPPRPRHGAEQPRRPLQRGGPPPGRPGPRRGSRPALPRPGRRQPRLPPRPRQGAEQPRQPLQRGGPPPGRPGPRRGSRPAAPRPGRRQPRLPPRPRQRAEQPRRPLQRGGPPPGRPSARRGSRPALPRPGRRATPPSSPTSPWR